MKPKPTFHLPKPHHRRAPKPGKAVAAQAVIEANAAGVDVGAREMYVCIPADRDAEPVRVYRTFTSDLHALADWLVERKITTVAMESTGVYWIPLYEILEERKIQVCLVNARHMKNVPGRRTDWHECQWLQYLHSVGLLRAAFRPDAEVRAIRSVMRYRAQLVEMACQHVQHMHKSLTQMNLQIHHVISDMMGVTGQAMIQAILGGERDAAKLAELCQPEIQADRETIQKSLQGNWRREHLFTLQRAWELYREHVRGIAACDQEIVEMLSRMEPKVDAEQKPMPADGKRRTRRRHQRTGDFHFDVRQEAYKRFGVDVTQEPGISGIALPLYSEVGADMSKWPNADAFIGWLGLCPDNDKTGGRVVWRGVRRQQNRAAQLFRQGASCLHHSPTRLGQHLRRMKATLGPQAGITATAHKMARVFYTIVKNRVEYDETIWQQQDAQRQRRQEAKLRRQARQLGYDLVPRKQKP